MQPIQQELEWEREMMYRGIRRYRSMQQKAIEGKRSDETSAGRRLLGAYIDQISACLAEYLSGGSETRRAPNAAVLMSMPVDTIAFIGLKAMMLSVFMPDTLVAGVCNSIGGRIEDEYNFMRLEAEHKEYHDGIMRTLESKGSTNYEFMRKSILSSYRLAKNVEIAYWTTQQRISVGLIVMQLIRTNCDLFEIVVASRAGEVNSETKMLRPTQACLDWVQNHDDAMELMFPDRMPMLVPPADWVAPDDGGYYLPELRGRTSLVINARGHRKEFAKLYREAKMPKVYSAVNWIQRTPWRINTKVMEVLHTVWEKNLGVGMPATAPYEFPPSPLDPGVTIDSIAGTKLEEEFNLWKEETRLLHTLEAERVAKCMMISRNVRMAQEMSKHEEFYYVYRMDFRGRIYAATTGLSPQGPDQGKGLLEFAEGRALGPRGLYWLKVHGANKWGEDKCSYDARVAWIEARHDQWLAVAADPIETRSIWADAYKPYQFLAFCFEYAEAARVGDSYRSHLPIALDGSCNGLQHLSAMLRDEVGGSAVNLVPQDTPADIYQTVADVTTAKLVVLAQTNDPEQAGARNWLRLFRKLTGSFHMTRKLPKPPVMTKPYGSTQRTCTQSIYTWYRKNGGDFFGKNTGFRHAVYLTPVMWQSIDEVVVAARAAMDWLRQSAGTISKAGQAVQFTSPLGFPVMQKSMRREERKIKTAIGGGIRIRVLIDMDKLDGMRMRSGISPNFVHNLDATHLCMTVNAGAETGMTSFAMIHDDFGTHACCIDDMHRVIRQTFVQLYTEQDVLEDFKRVHEERGIALNDTPPRGSLVIEDVIKSDYFFG